MTAPRTRGARRDDVVGRAEELRAIRAALSAGCDLLLEGPPGTGKSTLLRHIAVAGDQPFVLVEGSGQLTPSQMVGHHDPGGVLAHGYGPEHFVPGPLAKAMSDGALLYVEEFNRVPEDTVNVLLGPLQERALEIPHYGRVAAAEDFRFVAAMNPFDEVGTLKMSRTVLDRLTRLSVDYQDASEELRIVRARAGGEPTWVSEVAVALARATRSHPELRAGASVRGAIDLVMLTRDLARLRDVDVDAEDDAAKAVVLDAAYLALSGRVTVDESSERTAEQIIEELWQDALYFLPRRAFGDGVLPLESAITRRQQHGIRAHRRTGPRRLPRPSDAEIGIIPRAGTADQEPILQRPGGVAPLGATSSRGRAGESAVSAHPDPDDASLAELLDELVDDGDDMLAELTDLQRATESDVSLDALLRALALRIVLRTARRTVTPHRGAGEIRARRYRFHSDDLDLDRTLEEIAGNPYPGYDDFWVRERMRTKRAFVLMLDVSGSMRGSKLIHAAVAAGALARNVEHDDLGVLAFWRDAALLKSIEQPRPVRQLIDDLLRLQARGLTNLSFALRSGLRELERSRARERVGILFTDGMHNLGEDPLRIAERYPRLHVIGTSVRPLHVHLCHQLADHGHGTCVFIQDPRDVPEAITTCMAA